MTSATYNRTNIYTDKKKQLSKFSVHWFWNNFGMNHSKSKTITRVILIYCVKKSNSKLYVVTEAAAPWCSSKKVLLEISQYS